ncbi:MAG: YlbF family regulator [Eubacteriales bacterium]|nr:YlbF family regulator [Eubacteriales bacterium]
MKDNVEIYTMALVRVIQDSREYRAYNDAKRKLADMPELKRQINDYRKEMFRLQNYADESTLYEQLEEFSRQHEAFRRDTLVDEYLRTELAVCRMLQKAARTVTNSVDLELDDIAGELRS